MKLRIATGLAFVIALTPMLQGCFPVIAGGVAAGVLAADDRRTLGTQAEDKTIFAKAESRINERFGDRAHVNVTSFNRRVLLTGEVADVGARAEVERVVGGVENVSAIVNELQVAGISSITARTNDTIITSKVKGNFIDERNMASNAIKVVTEASVVYLLGLVTRAEADLAARVASRTSGVKQVVKVFDYIPVAPATSSAK